MSRPNKTIVVGGVPEHFNLPWHQAIESGAFQAANIDLEFREMPGGTGAMTKGLRNGELDIAILLTEGAIKDLYDGNPSKLVKTYVESPLIWGIHVAADSKLESVEDIKGQTYAISRFGSGSHLMSIVDAAERGWPTDELEFEKVGNLDGARTALKDGSADNFLWERFTTSPFVQSGEFRRVGERRTPWPAFMVCVRNDLLQSRANDVQTILEIVNDFCKKLMTNEEACELISERYGIRLEDVQEWFAQTKWSTDFDEPVKEIESATNYLAKLELVDIDDAPKGGVWLDL